MRCNLHILRIFGLDRHQKELFSRTNCKCLCNLPKNYLNFFYILCRKAVDKSADLRYNISVRNNGVSRVRVYRNFLVRRFLFVQFAKAVSAVAAKRRPEQARRVKVCAVSELQIQTAIREMSGAEGCEATCSGALIGQTIS